MFEDLKKELKSFKEQIKKNPKVCATFHKMSDEEKKIALDILNKTTEIFDKAGEKWTKFDFGDFGFNESDNESLFDFSGFADSINDVVDGVVDIVNSTFKETCSSEKKENVKSEKKEEKDLFDPPFTKKDFKECKFNEKEPEVSLKADNGKCYCSGKARTQFTENEHSVNNAKSVKTIADELRDEYEKRESTKRNRANKIIDYVIDHLTVDRKCAKMLFTSDDKGNLAYVQLQLKENEITKYIYDDCVSKFVRESLKKDIPAKEVELSFPLKIKNDRKEQLYPITVKIVF